VQSGQIVFHEIAEAYAKLELGLDYLDHGLRSGAHAIALEREQRLKSQRPSADIVMTAGSNRLLRTEAEIRLFYAETAAGLASGKSHACPATFAPRMGLYTLARRVVTFCSSKRTKSLACRGERVTVALAKEAKTETIGQYRTHAKRHRLA